MRPRIIQGLDDRTIAGALFNVFPERVTLTMMARMRVIRFVYSTYADDVWPNCPNCKQPATGRYWLGKAGCNRCGWSEGGNRDKKGEILG